MCECTFRASQLQASKVLFFNFGMNLIFRQHSAGTCLGIGQEGTASAQNAADID